jgi:hypothetical protein
VQAGNGHVGLTDIPAEADRRSVTLEGVVHCGGTPRSVAFNVQGFEVTVPPASAGARGGRRRSAEVSRRPAESPTPRLPREERGGENPDSRFPQRRQYRDPLGDHEVDKIMRRHTQIATIENGFVHLPEAAHWLSDYLAEFMLFPNARYDDQVDSTAQALACGQQSPVHAMLECWRRLAEEAER